MQKNVFIYNEQLKVVARPFIDSIEEFKLNPEKYYPNWAVNMYFSEFELTNPKLDAGELREKTREELIFEDNKLDLLVDGEYIEGGKIIKVEYNKELGYLKPVWNRELKQWLDGATDLEKVQAQISEYSELDTPSTLKEMGTELANECMDMLIQLRNMAYTLGNPATIEDRDLLVLPKPSEKLKQFKNKYNSIR